VIRYGVRGGHELLELAGDARCIAIAGSAKNAGKTTAAAALAAAMSEPFGIVSAGRDGERFDELDSRRKPRLRLPAGTLFATVRSLLPRSPACEIVEVTPERGALGDIVIARSRATGRYEVAGTATAAGLRRVIDTMQRRAGVRVIADGALDRAAALRSGDAVVVAVGAEARDENGVAAAAAAIVRRLATPPADPDSAALTIDGALTSELAAKLAANGETRQVVVRDPTRITARGDVLARLTVRTLAPLRPIACVTNSIGRDRALDPARLLVEVARATGLPAFDLYAGAACLP
jgi:hypothetical protein